MGTLPDPDPGQAGAAEFARPCPSAPKKAPGQMPPRRCACNAINSFSVSPHRLPAAWESGTFPALKQEFAPAPFSARIPTPASKIHCRGPRVWHGTRRRRGWPHRRWPQAAIGPTAGGRRRGWPHRRWSGGGVAAHLQRNAQLLPQAARQVGHHAQLFRQRCRSLGA